LTTASAISTTPSGTTMKPKMSLRHKGCSLRIA
jgi:hypothetical protein